MYSAAVREHALALIRSGLSDCEVARQTGVARTTIRDWRRPRYQPRTPAAPRPTCPRCGGKGRRLSFTQGDYAELLGLYLGDGHIVRMPRTWQLRIFLDSRHPEMMRETEEMLSRCFGGVAVGKVFRHQGRMTVLGVYCLHVAASSLNMELARSTSV